MTNLTSNERIALNMIALNLYQPVNGARPETFDDTSAVWSNCLDSNGSGAQLTGRTLSATCASLAKKGLVTTYDDRNKRDSTIELTEAGFEAWQAAWPAECEHGYVQSCSACDALTAIMDGEAEQVEAVRAATLQVVGIIWYG